MARQRRRARPRWVALGVAASVVVVVSIAIAVSVVATTGGGADRPSAQASAEPDPSAARTFGATMHPFADETYAGSTIAVSGARPPSLQDGSEYAWDDTGAIAYPAGVPQRADDLRLGAGGILLSTGGANPQSIYGAFRTSAERFAFHVNAWTTGDITVYVDGYPVAADPTVISAGEAFVEVSGLPDQTHDVQFVLGPSATLIGVIAPAGRSVSALEESGFRVGIVGDSYTDVGLAPNYAGLVREIHRLTGWTIVQLGQGSTGYVNDGSSSGNASLSPYGSRERLAALDAAHVDALIVVGSTNDIRASSADVDGDLAAARAAATAYYAAVGAIPTIVVGPEPISVAEAPEMTAVWDRLNKEILDAARAAPNVVGVIDWRGEDWLTGTGSVPYPRGDGNQDTYLGLPDGSDTVHPNYLGNRYLAGRLVSAIAPMPLTIPRP